MARPGPLNDDAGVGFDDFDSHGNRDAVHLPLPLNLPASLEASGASGEPELRGDFRVHERVEDDRDGPANEHAGSCNRYLRQLEIVHVVYSTHHTCSGASPGFARVTCPTEPIGGGVR